MINGFVTFEELQIITGLSDNILKTMILQGLSCNELCVDSWGNKLTQKLYDLHKVECWISSHIF